MTHSATREQRDELKVSGFNETEAAIFAGVTLGLGALLYLLGRRLIGLAPFAALLLLSALVAAGSRYTLRVSKRGIELTLFQGWIFPVMRKRYLLDASVELYEAWEADKPEGLSVRPLFGWGEHETECFGPAFVQAHLLELHRRVMDTLVRARSSLEVTASTPHFDDAPMLDDALEENGRTYWPVNGRLKSARLKAQVTIDEMVLPAGSTIEANTGEFMDPRRSDLFKRVTLSGPSAPCLPHFPMAQAGAVFGFDRKRGFCSARNAFAERLTLGEAIIDGRATLSWGKDGQLEQFCLGAPLVVGDLLLPAGSRFSQWILPLRGSRKHWYVHPSMSVQLPQVTVAASNSLLIANDFSRVLGVMLDHDLTVDGITLKGGLLHFPLDPSLRVDLKECERLALVREHQRL